MDIPVYDDKISEIPIRITVSLQLSHQPYQEQPQVVRGPAFFRAEELQLTEHGQALLFVAHRLTELRQGRLGRITLTVPSADGVALQFARGLIEHGLAFPREAPDDPILELVDI